MRTQRSSTARSPRTKLAASLAALFVCACQAVLGDFELAPEPASRLELGSACEPGAARCSDALLETCNDERTGWSVAHACASADECNVNSQACRPCTPGEYMCRGSTLVRCNEALAWVDPQECASPELCSVAPDARSGSCAQAVCDVAGTHSCDGARLLRCAPGRNELELVDLCATPELCDGAYADELVAGGARGACRPAACPAGAFRCDGAKLERCRFDQTGWEEIALCDSPDLCNVRAGACTPCEPEQVGCNGAVLRRCTPELTWSNLKTCPNPSLCDAALGDCQDAECDEPGRLVCGRDGIPRLERCGSDQRWETLDVCVTVALCSVSAGGCLAPACDEGELRCHGSDYQRCSDDLTRWETLDTCETGENCSVELGCVAGACEEGSVRCNGATLERCVEGRFRQERHCESAALCDAAASTCLQPMCGGSLGEFRCRTETIIQSCAPTRAAWGDDFRTCPAGSFCDPEPALGTGLPECDVCTPNAFECEGLELFRCSSDGQTRIRLATCPTECSANGGTATCT